MVCSNCGIGGHNKRTCPKKQVIATPFPTSIFAEWVDRGVGAWMDASGIPTKPKTSCMEVEIALLCLVKELPQEAQNIIVKEVFCNRLPLPPSTPTYRHTFGGEDGGGRARQNSIYNTLLRCNRSRNMVSIANAGNKQFGKERTNKAQFQIYFYTLEAIDETYTGLFSYVKIYNTPNAGALKHLDKCLATGLITAEEAQMIRADAMRGKREFKGLSVSTFSNKY